MSKVPFILFIILYFSCTSSYENKNDEHPSQFQSIFRQLGDTTSPDYYMIIPMKGCSGCIDEALGFLRSRTNNAKITFIVTSNERKTIALKLTEIERNSKNVIVDWDNLLGKSGLIDGTVLLIQPSNDQQQIRRKQLTADSLTYNLAKLFELTSR